MATASHTARTTAPTTHRGDFVKMPTAVLYETELSDGDKVAYAVLANYAWATGQPTFEMTGDQLAALLGKSRKRATERVAALEGAGWLRVEGRRGLNRPNRYTVVDNTARKRRTRGAGNDAAGSVGNDATGWDGNDAPSTTTDRPDEKTSGAGEVVEDDCAHGVAGGSLRNATGAIRCPVCRRAAEPLF